MPLRWLLPIFIFVQSAVIRAQDAPSVQELEARIARIEAAALSEQVKAAVLDTYRAAIAAVQEAAQRRDAAAQFDSLRDSAPQRLAELRQSLAESPVEPEKPPPQASLDDLRTRLTALRAELDGAKRSVQDLETEAATRTRRRGELPTQIREFEDQIAALDARVAVPPDATLLPEQREAKQLELRAQRDRVVAERSAAGAEVASYEARGELLVARRELADRNRIRVERAVALWQAEVDRLAAAEAQRAEAEAREATRRAARLHPALVALAQENETYAGRATEILDKRQGVRRASEDAGKSAERVQRDFDEAKEKFDKVGLIEAIGVQLRQNRLELPDAGALARRAATRRATLDIVQFELIDYRRAKADLSDLEQRVDEFMLSVALRPNDVLADLRGEATRLLASRKDALSELINTCDGYFDDLVLLTEAEHRLIEAVERFSLFIDERVLWIRSALPVWRADWRPLLRAIGWMFSPVAATEAIAGLGEDIGDLPIAWTLALMLLVLLVVRRGRLFAALEEARTAAVRGSNVSMRPTWVAIIATLALTVPLPLSLGWLGWRLIETGSTEWARSVGYGLGEIAIESAWIILLWRVCAPAGLGAAHFGWGEPVCNRLTRRLRPLATVYLLCVLLMTMLGARSQTDFQASAGRIAFVVGGVALAIWLHQVLHPARGFLALIAGADPKGLLVRMRRMWHVLAIGSIAALIALSLAGFEFTALRLGRSVGESIALVLALVFLQSLAKRGLVLARRRLAIQRARQARAAKDTPTGADAIPDVEQALDLRTVDAQSRATIRFAFGLAVIIGLFAIWVDVLPALGFLDQTELWSDGDTAVTLAEVIVGFIVLAATFLAARNLPGLLEITVLQRLNVPQGERYAVVTVFRYVIVLIGVISAFSSLGIGWSKVQWLAAAVTVGLGFGLQEIFANFFSGLLILFERPIRVGDIVSIGDADGTVAKIRMRATTVLDWNRRELIVPNKEIVTGRVINWTLSDSITRITVPVGIAYGSDTEKARALLAECAAECPFSLSDPPARPVFYEFGDSALTFRLYLYIPNREVYLDTMHWLHTHIDQAFREHGIEIAFPQRDVHVRSFPSIGAAMQADATLARGEVGGL